MPVLEVLTYPNPILKQVSQPVAEITDEIRTLVAELLETLDSHPGCVGLASPQTGNLVRIIIIDASRNRKPVPNQGRMIMINPIIEAREGEELAREGCLSLPDFTANVKRAATIRVRATTLDGTEINIESVGFEARVIQHEYDHLDGLLFLDRVSSLKTDVFRRKRYSVPEGAAGALNPSSLA
jgi:peptide deformylase